jgi:hypothetical protein
MNKRDRDNLNFILNINEEAFANWMVQADKDDINYALTLIENHRNELSLKRLLLRYNDDNINTTEAEQLLQKFRIN